MNKSDPIRMLAEKEGLTLKMAESTVNTVFNSIEQALSQGGPNIESSVKLIVL
ncbi:HU family DNA-binding protein [Desulfoferula mesophila]|uniref:HU family DNA-binding protein n=1 Tax=Desulfoferula mesophila TaxID=3058419 RepID=A0AAU9EL17_9BACT|nr:hypothetical protein FAK_29200 [Desulfoferula mesophilus]